VHVRDEGRVARPQARVVADACQVDGQCRTPSSCSENRNLTNGKLLYSTARVCGGLG
jgi:hypothetical protein